MRRILLMSVVTLVLATLPFPAFAHRFWLLPSQTIYAGGEAYVTVDAAISNDIFYFNHHAMGLDDLVVTAPDGSNIKTENQATLRYRSVFDVPLTQPGTYRISVVSGGMFASWQEDGQRRRWRGNAESFATEVPANAQDLNVSENVRRVETFVTNGAPTDQALQPTGKGIELVPVTHPNDLYAGEECRFRFLIDGQPAQELEIKIIKGGTRYRNIQNEQRVVSDANGEVAIHFESPGMYWLEASLADDKASISKAENRRLTYVATLEVLPQ